MQKERVQDVFAYALGFKPLTTTRHRLLVIVTHILLWSLFLTLPMLIYRIEILDTQILYREIINKTFLIGLFYFHYYYLIPRFFKKKKLLNYFLSLLASLLFICLQQLAVEHYFMKYVYQRGGKFLAHRARPAFHRIAPFAKAASMPRVMSRLYMQDSLLRHRLAQRGDTGNITLVKASPYNVVYSTRPAMAGLTDGPQDGAVVGFAGMGAGEVAFASTGQDSMLLTPPGPPPFEGTTIVTDSLGETKVFHSALTEAGEMKTVAVTDSVITIPAGKIAMLRDRMRKTVMGIPVVALPMIITDILTSAILMLLISGFIKLANSLIISQKQKKILETERLNAELNFLKLQINPHFLFNTLNSIYSQAHLRSEQTEYSILKFSQIMRYVLYDSTTEKIALSKDLEYIKNYIDLQKLRISRNVAIHFNVTGNTNNLLIPPLLLITFIENAFKHGISYTIPSEIRINIELVNNVLLLTVGNAVVNGKGHGDGGVGLINAKRRLDVLYPNRHLLDIVENDSLYIVNLKIELDYEN